MACSSLLSEDDLRRFRTKPCRRNRQQPPRNGQSGMCEFGPDRCQYSHSNHWARRCPFYLSNKSSIRYIPKVCPDVILGQNGEESETRTIGTVISNKCNRGGSCPYAHSLEEILYHPLWYKTKRCPYFGSGDCKTYYCPFVHGIAETRDIQSETKYTLPFTDHLFSASPLPNVEIAGKITSSHSRQQSDFENSCLPQHLGHQQQTPEKTTGLSASYKGNKDSSAPYYNNKNNIKPASHLHPGLSDSAPWFSTKEQQPDSGSDLHQFNSRRTTSHLRGEAPPLPQFPNKSNNMIDRASGFSMGQQDRCTQEEANVGRSWLPPDIDYRNMSSEDRHTWSALLNALGFRLLDSKVAPTGTTLPVVYSNHPPPSNGAFSPPSWNRDGHIGAGCQEQDVWKGAACRRGWRHQCSSRPVEKFVFKPPAGDIGNFPSPLSQQRQPVQNFSEESSLWDTTFNSPLPSHNWDMLSQCTTAPESQTLTFDPNRIATDLKS